MNVSAERLVLTADEVGVLMAGSESAPLFRTPTPVIGEAGTLTVVDGMIARGILSGEGSDLEINQQLLPLIAVAFTADSALALGYGGLEHRREVTLLRAADAVVMQEFSARSGLHSLYAIAAIDAASMAADVMVLDELVGSASEPDSNAGPAQMVGVQGLEVALRDGFTLRSLATRSRDGEAVTARALTAVQATGGACWVTDSQADDAVFTRVDAAHAQAQLAEMISAWR